MATENISLTDEEKELIVKLVGQNYRSAHREAWDVKVSGNPKYLPELRQKLADLEAILKKLGSSPEDVMRPVKGNHPIEAI